MSDPIPVLRSIAQKAEAAILAVYESEVQVDFKADSSPVTEADRRSHEVLVEGLEANFPGIPILSEESGPEAFEARTGWSEYWLVDPLDGTKEFLHRNGEFTVNVALIRDGKPVLGVVTVPVTGVGYSGSSKGAETWKKDSPAESIRTEPANLETLRVVTSRSHKSARLEGLLKRYPGASWSSAGSSLKFCRVATGTADLYPRLAPTSEWDTAAAQAVLEAAGGQVLDLEGEPLRYSKASLLNPWFLALGDPSLDWRQFVPPELAAEARSRAASPDPARSKSS